MKYVKIRVFGRELLNIEYGTKEHATPTAATMPDPKPQEQQAGTKLGDVGPGQGIIQERAWTPTVRRPIGSSPLGFRTENQQ